LLCSVGIVFAGTPSPCFLCKILRTKDLGLDYLIKVLIPKGWFL